MQTSFTVVISFVLAWWIINEFEKVYSKPKVHGPISAQGGEIIFNTPDPSNQ